MKHARALIILSLCLFCFANNASAISDDLKRSVDELVLTHHFHGIPYNEAKALGVASLDYLFTLLEKPEHKPYWVNIIVTIGFIERSEGLQRIIGFLEIAQGEVETQHFRALLSVPFAIGCIASNGDEQALNYLERHARKQNAPAARWRFRRKTPAQLLSEKSLVGLAVSARPRARQILQQLKTGMDSRRTLTTEPAYQRVNRSLDIMDRIAAQGRASVFNPADSNRNTR